MKSIYDMDSEKKSKIIKNLKGDNKDLKLTISTKEATINTLESKITEKDKEIKELKL